MTRKRQLKILRRRRKQIGVLEEATREELKDVLLACEPPDYVPEPSSDIFFRKLLTPPRGRMRRARIRAHKSTNKYERMARAHAKTVNFAMMYGAIIVPNGLLEVFRPVGTATGRLNSNLVGDITVGDLIEGTHP